MTASVDQEPMLRFFRYEHLSAGDLRAMSAQFAGLAQVVCDRIPPSPERTRCLNELKVAKDWAVCAVVDVLERGGTPPAPNLPDPAFTGYQDPGVPGGVAQGPDTLTP